MNHRESTRNLSKTLSHSSTVPETLVRSFPFFWMFRLVLKVADAARLLGARLWVNQLGGTTKNSCQRKNFSGASLVFRKGCLIEKLFFVRGYHDYCRISLSHSAEKFHVEPLGVSESFWYRKLYLIEGYRDFCSIFFVFWKVLRVFENFWCWRFVGRDFFTEDDVTKKMSKTLCARERIREGGLFGVQESMGSKKFIRNFQRFFFRLSGKKKVLWAGHLVFLKACGFEKFLLEGRNHEVRASFFVSLYRKVSVEGTFWRLWVLARACYRLYLQASSYCAMEKVDISLWASKNRVKLGTEV